MIKDVHTKHFQITIQGCCNCFGDRGGGGGSYSKGLSILALLKVEIISFGHLPPFVSLSGEPGMDYSDGISQSNQDKNSSGQTEAEVMNHVKF